MPPDAHAPSRYNPNAAQLLLPAPLLCGTAPSSLACRPALQPLQLLPCSLTIMMTPKSHPPSHAKHAVFLPLPAGCLEATALPSPAARPALHGCAKGQAQHAPRVGRVENAVVPQARARVPGRARGGVGGQGARVGT